MESMHECPQVASVKQPMTCTMAPRATVALDGNAERYLPLWDDTIERGARWSEASEEADGRDLSLAMSLLIRVSL